MANRALRPLLSAVILVALRLSATPASAQATGVTATAPADTGVVSGRVFDAAGKLPLANANIRVRDGGARTVSGADGRFTLQGAPTSPFTLVATFVGYEAALLRVDPSRGAELEVRLVPMVQPGEEVVVTASRYGRNLHLSHTDISRQEIAARGDVRDIPILLEGIPGVYASSDAGNGVGYTYLSVRGFDQRRIGVMINGIPLNDPEDHQVYWVDMPDLAASLEDIQVQRGVTNSMGGMTSVGGTVNLVTEVLDAEPSGQLSVESGSYGTAKQSISYQTGLLAGRIASQLRVTHLESDGYRQRSGSDQWAAFWSGRFASSAHELQANVYTGRERTRHAWYGIGPRTLASDRTWNPETYSNAVDDFRQPHYELHWQWKPSGRVKVQASAFAIHGEGYYENFRGGESARAYGLDSFLGLDPGAEVDVVRQKWVRKDQVGWVPQVAVSHRGGRLIAGGDWYTFHSHHWGEVTGVAGFTPDDVSDGLRYASYAGDKVAWSAYVNDQLRVAPGVTLLVDLQYQRKSYDFMQNEAGNFTSMSATSTDPAPRNAYRVEHDWFNPKGGIYWETPAHPLGGRVGLYAHAGIAHREPADADYFDAYQDAYDLGARPLFRTARAVTSADGSRIAYVRWSDPIVHEEKVVNWEGGLSWRARDLSLTLNGYRMDFTNEIVESGALTDEGSPVRGNAGKTLHRGIEASASARFAGRHELRSSVSRSWDEFRDYVYLSPVYDPQTWEITGVEPHDYGGNPIAGFPEWLASVALTSDWNAVTTSIRFRGAGRQHLDNTGITSRTIAPWGTLDISTSLDTRRRTRGALAGGHIDFRLRNALDRKYATRGYWDEWDATDPGNHVMPAAGRNWLAGVRYDF